MFDKSLKATAGATRFIRQGHACLGVSGPAGLTLTAGDHNDSLLWSRQGGDSGKAHAWSPWGNGNTTDRLPGFNGERPDPVSGSYHLGNGYRAYNPVLRRFNCPDSLSPFGAGGINPYAYCLGDPVNRTDPTGHISWQGIVGIVGGVIGVVLTGGAVLVGIAAAGGLAAAWSSASATALVVGGLGLVADVAGIASGATEDANPAASSVLGWVSMATGIAGMAAGAGMAAKGIMARKKTVAERRARVQTDSHHINVRAENQKITAKYNRNLFGDEGAVNSSRVTFFDPDTMTDNFHLFDSDFLVTIHPPSRVPYTRTTDLSGAKSYLSNNSPSEQNLSVNSLSFHTINSEDSSFNSTLNLKPLGVQEAINFRPRSLDHFPMKSMNKYRARMLRVKNVA